LIYPSKNRSKREASFLWKIGMAHKQPARIWYNITEM
jgi:hypothetical protein